MRRVFKTASSRATEAIGFRIGLALGNRPAIVGLRGPLGAGKTSLVRGLVAAIDQAAAAEVCSPTYAVANLYAGPRLVWHLDLYRLRSDDDLESIAFAEMLDQIVLIEWFDRLESVERLVDVAVTIERRGPRARTIDVESRTGRGGELLAALDQLPAN